LFKKRIATSVSSVTEILFMQSKCPFGHFANPIFEQMVSLNHQNQRLKEARDILLPRLMNRTIEV